MLGAAVPQVVGTPSATPSAALSDPLPAGVVNALVFGTDSRDPASLTGNADAIVVAQLSADLLGELKMAEMSFAVAEDTRKTSEDSLIKEAVEAFKAREYWTVSAVLASGMLLSASNLGAWGVLYAVTPEIYPTRLRGAAAGAAAAVGRIAAIIAPLLMPWFLTLSGGNKAVAFIIFAAAFIIACVAALCLPERKGLDLED